MNPSDILPTIAEIAVSIVGFAAVLFALGNRGANEKQTMNMFRIKIMVETGMLTIFLSLTPVLLLSIPSLAPYTWRISCPMLAVLMAGYTLLAFHRQSRLVGKYLESKLDVTVTLFELPIFTLMVMVGFEWGAVPPFGTYLFGLFFWMGISMLMFVRIILDSASPSHAA